MFKSLFQKFFFSQKDKEEELKKIRHQAKEIIIEAEKESRRITQNTKNELTETIEIEKRLLRKEQQIDQKEQLLENEKTKLLKERQLTEQTKKNIDETRELMLQKLEKIASLTKDQARNLLLQGWEEKLKTEVVKKIKTAEEQIKERVDEKSKQILLDAMRYGATDIVAEFTLSVVNLPNDEYKGRIIGKDGRNIRAFEIATGVDVDLEEEGVIRLSSFDAIRREIARLSLERLIKDGRIQPLRIEEIVVKTREEIEKVILRAGEELAHKVGIFNFPPEITKLLGRFKYRYSYGQSMMIHTLEETKIGVALAHELHADVNVVKLGCLLHDIGKVISDKEGSHVDLGVELLKRYRFPQKIIDCVASHHEDIPFTSTEAIIVYIADAVSGGRPGARHEDLQEYLKRIKTIEDVAKTRKGVKEAYALQAGRELRVIVKPNEITDDEATIMAVKMKEELEKKFEVFPGQIKVTVIREYRADATTKI